MKKRDEMRLKPFTVIIFCLGFFFCKAQNSDLPVGSLPGSIDVSATGAATYTIPIEVVPGTAGVQPNLSIVYNSQSGRGLLGMKWTLGGLSAISRAPQTEYYYGKQTGISLTDLDRFTLDGNRLILINNQQYGKDGALYAFESENFARITGHSDGHYAFKMMSEDGTLTEYGYPDNSKWVVAASNSNYQAVSWMVNKVIDKDGNYMVFHYGASGTERWIDSITYTGNGTANLSPYASVKFTYIVDPVSANTVFSGGSEGIAQTRLIKEIRVYYKNQQVRRYSFNYDLTRTAHLTGITLYGEDNSTAFTSTTVAWETNARTITMQYPTNPGTNYQVITGDFTGDGITDLVYYTDGTSSSGTWKLYRGNSYGGYSCTATGSLGAYGTNGNSYRSILRAGDIDGEGKDNLIIAERVSQSNFQYKCHYLTFDASGVLINDADIYYISELVNVMIGDFDGNGKADIVFQSRDNSIFFWSRTISTSIVSFRNFPATLALVEANNDGKTEVQITDALTLIYDYTFQPPSQHNGVFTPVVRTFPSNRHNCYYGDFNGDGITDILYHTPSGSTWNMCMGTGNCDYSYPAYQFSGGLNTELYDGNPLYPPLIADVDGDGKDDIIQVVSDREYSSIISWSIKGATIHVYYSRGYANGSYRYEHQSLYTDYITEDNRARIGFQFNDFNGDGKMDLLVKQSGKSPVIIFFDKNKKYEFVKQITDGLGNSQKIAYKPIHATANYWMRSNSFGMSKRVFFYVTDSLYCTNGLNNGWNKYTYDYRTPRYSVPRRQFLGFELFTIRDLQTNRTTQQTFWYYQPSSYGRRELFLPYRTIVEGVSRKTVLYTPATDLAYPRFYFSKITERDTNQLTQSATFSEVWFYTDNDANKGRLYRKTAMVVDLNNYGNILTQSKTRYTYNYTTLTSSNMAAYQMALPNYVYDSAFVSINYTSSQRKYTFSGHRLQSVQEITPYDGTVTTTYSGYTAFGQPCTTTLSSSGLTSRTATQSYDNTGRFVTASGNPKGQYSYATYDPKTGNVLTTTDINSLTTTCRYDLFGRQRAVVHPDNTKDSVMLFWYTASQIPNACYYSKNYTTGLAAVTIYYDRLGRELCRQANGSYSDTRYNNLGQVKQTSLPYAVLATADASKTWHTYTYDTYGRITSETAPYTDISYVYSTQQTSVTDNLKHITTTKTYDAVGRPVTVVEPAPGGTIRYAYAIATDNSKKRLRTTITTSGANSTTTTTTTFTDARGNRTKIIDPDAGTITSVYNAYGELTQQTDANGNVTACTYDQLGRIVTKSYTGAAGSQTLTYTYDTYSAANKGRGQLSNIKMDNVTTDSYTYDILGRPAQKSKIIDGTTYTQSYTYNSNGQLDVLAYPNNFAIKHSYDTYGRLQQITRNSDNALIYKVNDWNIFGSITEYNYGNNIYTAQSYNTYGLLTQIKRGNAVAADPGGTTGPVDGGTMYRSIGALTADNITTQSSTLYFGTYSVNNAYQELNYTYNTLGQFTQRANAKNGQTEAFTYDNLNRLTSYRINTGAAKTFTYSANGNILTNPDAGSYTYGNSAHPHGVSAITLNSSNVQSSADCEVAYNWYNQPLSITEGNTLLTFSYGSNGQRTKTILTQGATMAKTKYFISPLYEKEVALFSTRHLNYIYGADGAVVAILTQTSATDAGTMYYVHTDHLGSYTLITDASKNRIDSLWFDAWGNRKQYNNWANADTRTSFLFDRGFTGHEHLDRFKIINMNGRLYDPVIARFFSPDPFVQMPGVMQNYNRYSYCLNNPLMYTDPSGEFIQYIVYAIHYLATGFENMLNGVPNPWKDAAQKASHFVNGVNSAWRFQIYQSEQASVSAGLDMFAFGASISASYTQGGSTVGVSAGYSFLGGWYVGGNFAQQIGNFNVGFGIGAGNNHWGWNASMDYAGFGAGYGQTYYGSAPGFGDGKPHPQRTGAFTFYTPSIRNFPATSFRMENDVWGDGKDRWRTSAYEASIGPFILGTNLYTNAPDQNISDDAFDKAYSSKIWNKGIKTYPDSKVFSSPVYIGYRQGNMVTRIGINHPGVQDLTQNGMHLLRGSPLLYTPYGNYCDPYFYSGYYNPYSLYY